MKRIIQSVLKLSVFPQLVFFIFARIVLMSSMRVVYPFLSVFAAGLGVSIGQVSLAVSVRSLIAAFNPLLASFSDRRGRKAGMLLGLGMFTCGMLLVILLPSFVTFFLTLGMGMMGLLIFTSSMQAYLGDRVAYDQRALVIGLTEWSWALSFAVGMPILAFALAYGTWLSPFMVLAVAGGILFLLTLKIIPRTLPTAGRETKSLDSLQLVLTTAPAVAGLVMGACLSAANETISLMFGVWLQDSFGLQIAALGAASAVIGVAEFGGETLTAGIVDRLGKPLAIRIGLGLNMLSVLLLPIIGGSVLGALVGLFLFYLSFEFTVVSMMTMMTEVMPAARATLMGACLAALAIGRAISDVISPWLYEWSFLGNVLLAMILDGVAWMLLSRVKIADTSPVVD
ncbi:MAG: MFS transporter [Anaerolineales bacterium]